MEHKGSLTADDRYGKISTVTGLPYDHHGMYGLLLLCDRLNLSKTQFKLA